LRLLEVTREWRKSILFERLVRQQSPHLDFKSPVCNYLPTSRLSSVRSFIVAAKPWGVKKNCTQAPAKTGGNGGFANLEGSLDRQMRYETQSTDRLSNEIRMNCLNCGQNTEENRYDCLTEIAR